LKTEIIVVPHHGSVKTLEHDFIERLGADILICSSGPGQYERPDAIKRKDEAKLFSTARDGAITIRVSKDGEIRTDTFSKHR